MAENVPRRCLTSTSVSKKLKSKTITPDNNLVALKKIINDLGISDEYVYSILHDVFHMRSRLALQVPKKSNSNYVVQK